jgi:hypothetical protein
MEEGDASRLARAVLSQVQSQHSRTRWRKHLNMFLFLILMGFYLSSEASRLRSINPEKPPSPSQMTNKQLPKRYQYLGPSHSDFFPLQELNPRSSSPRT